MRTGLPKIGGVKYTGVMIEQALIEAGVSYTISVKEAVVHCIFHNDDMDGKPNLYINVDKKCGTYHCFRCGAKGPFSEYYQRGKGWTLIKTLKYLIDLSKRTRASTSNVDAGYVPSVANKDVAEASIDALVMTHSYLKERGLTEETARRWSVGYDASTDTIVLPWMDSAGRVVTLKRRSVSEKKYRYSSGADLTKTLFGLHLVRQHAFVWIVEGEFDAMFLDQVFRLAHLNNHYVVALGGSALLPTQVQALLKKQPDYVVFFLDNDDAGRKALPQARKTVGSSVKSIVAEYPSECEAKDPGELTFTEALNTALEVEKKVA